MAVTAAKSPDICFPPGGLLTYQGASGNGTSNKHRRLLVAGVYASYLVTRLKKVILRLNPGCESSYKSSRTQAQHNNASILRQEFSTLRGVRGDSTLRMFSETQIVMAILFRLIILAARPHPDPVTPPTVALVKGKLKTLPSLHNWWPCLEPSPVFIFLRGPDSEVSMSDRLSISHFITPPPRSVN